MKTIRVFIAALLIVLPGFSQQEESLSNDSILEMQQLGFSEALIINKIKASRPNFDLSTTALKKLKAANVPEAVIVEMFAAKKSAPAPSEGGPASSASVKRGVSNLPEFYGLYAAIGDTLIPLDPGKVSRIQGNPSFIYYAKTVAAAENLELIFYPKTEVPDTGDEQKDEWQKLVNGTRSPSRIPLRIRSLPGQPEMIELTSGRQLPRGYYQIGILGTVSRFRIVGADPIVEDLFPDPGNGAAFGPPVKKKKISDVRATTLNISVATDNPKIQPFIQEMVAAYGGLDVISRVSNVRFVSAGRNNVQNLGWLKVSSIFYFKFPNKLRQEAAFKGTSAYQQTIFIYNNGSYHGLSDGKPHTLSPRAQEGMRRAVCLAGVELLRPIIDGSIKVQMLSEEFKDGRAYTRLKCDCGSVEPILMVDSETHLIARVQYDLPNGKNKFVAHEEVLSDYQKVGGLMVPVKQSGYENGRLTSESTTVDVAGFDDIPDIYFEDPTLNFLIE